MKELHDKFQQMLGLQVEGVMASFGKALEMIDDTKKTIYTKLDAKFDEVMVHLPQPPAASAAPLQQHQQLPPRRDPAGRAKRVPLEPGQTSGAAATVVDAFVAPTATAEGEDYYKDEVDQNQNYMQPPTPPPTG